MLDDKTQERREKTRIWCGRPKRSCQKLDLIVAPPMRDWPSQVERRGLFALQALDWPLA